MLRILLLMACFGLLFQADAQTSKVDSLPPNSELCRFIVIDSIHVKGNKKTRTAAILRELEFQCGDSIEVEHIEKLLARNKLRLLNMGLFSNTEIEVLRWDIHNKIVLKVDIIETLFIYPIPGFAFADRNFNVWWRDQKRSLRRINYGLDLYHFNLSGNNDLLKFKAQLGYTHEIGLEYRRPWINRAQTIGFRSQLSFSRSREVNLRSSDNKQVFYFNENQFLRKQAFASLAFNYKPGNYASHTFALEWRTNIISDTIAQELNPDYFGAGASRQTHASFVYQYEIDLRDIRPYPLHGYYFKTFLRQNGLVPSDDLFLSRFETRIDKYLSFSKRWSTELRAIGRFSLPRRKPPFSNNQAMGYGASTVRGYEYYVVDGLDYGVLVTSFRVNLLDKTLNMDKFMPISMFKRFPLKVYFSFNNDLGYANDPYYASVNPLSNQLLYGYGVSLDIVAYYDKVGKIQYSRNALGEGGVFLYINSAF